MLLALFLRNMGWMSDSIADDVVDGDISSFPQVTHSCQIPSRTMSLMGTFNKNSAEKGLLLSDSIADDVVDGDKYKKRECLAIYVRFHRGRCR